jgi:hypothetical protein
VFLALVAVALCAPVENKEAPKQKRGIVYPAYHGALVDPWTGAVINPYTGLPYPLLAPRLLPVTPLTTTIVRSSILG